MNTSFVRFLFVSVFFIFFLSGCEDVNAPFQKVPDRRDVTIYQVNIRTFSEAGNLQGILPRLDAIKALGANVIYLMPTYPVGKEKSVNSPYCIQDYKAVNPEFGTLEDLKEVVRGAHRRGMAVIMDWVANHTSYDHVWIKNDGWYLKDSLGNITFPPTTNWTDVAQLNFENMDMRLEMIKCMKYWVKEANIDGFRCDYSDGPPYEFWKQAIDSLRNHTGHDLIMMSEGRRSDHFQAGFDYNFGFDYHENMRHVFSDNKSVLSIDSFNIASYKGTSEKQFMVRYTSNHDINGSEGTPLELFDGQKGSMAAFVVAAYMKSVPMVYAGQEVGTPDRMVFPFVEKNIDWTIHPEVTKEYQKILNFRNESEAIRRGKLTSFSSDNICAFSKKSQNGKALVFSNLRNSQQELQLPEQLKNTKWVDAFSGKTVKLTEKISLAPYEYMVLN